jgi:hypothetical protein
MRTSFPGLAGLPLREAHARHLRVAERHAGDDPVVARAGRAQDVVDDEVRLVRADVREQEFARGVAGRPDVVVRGAQSIGQHGLAVLIEPHAGRVEVVRFEPGAPARGHQQLGTLDHLAVRKVEPPPPPVVLSAVAGRPGQQPDALLLERGDERGRRILVLVGEDPGKDLDRGDARAEPGVDLGELDPDGPRPQDGDRAGTDSGFQMASLLVQYGPSSMPSMGGVTDSVPVARTIRSASTSVPSAISIRCGPTRRASSMRTRTPSRSNGLAPPPDCASMMCRARSRTARKSTSTAGTLTPKRSASRASAAILALRSMTLVGTQP